MSDRRDALLRRARAAFGVPPARTLAEVGAVIRGRGGEPFDPSPFLDGLADEFIRRELIAGAFTLSGREALLSRASEEEREAFTLDEEEIAEFDPLEYGAEEELWTTWSFGMSNLERVIVLLERVDAESDVVGGFRVYGAGQWVRESLWASTGVVPRDPGMPSRDSALFGEAFQFEGRARFTAAPVE
ncbi:hypothetical protein [Microbacterium gilvum]|uniref:Uncharacterized protein n=1 Tax=Microbacterium gilvum TaxID=1336204 RepID=A0ABP8ZWG9_9MICO